MENSKNNSSVQMNSRRGTRLFGLDLFRVALAFEILMFHSNGYVGCSYGKYVDLFLRAGAVTMTAFFILSGYVTQYTYGSRNFSDSQECKHFYLGRAINILPSYYIVAVLFCILIATESLQDQLLLLPTEVLSLQTIYTSLLSVTHNNGTWFISCIVFCYFVYPILAIMFKKLKSRTK